MTMKSIKTRTRLLTCLVVLAVVFATFLAGTFTSQASEDVFGDIELKVGDTLGFVYYTSQPYTENTIMRFTVNGRTSESRAYPNDGKCVFIFNDIYPHELAKEVTATIIVNGKETVSSEGLSIKSYLLQMLLDPNSTAAEYQFASDTLQYGEQTRLYRNANVDVADRDNVSITDDISTSIYKNYKPQNIDTNLVGHAQGLGVSASNIRLSAIGISYHNVNYFDITLSVPKGSSVNPQNLAVVIGDETEENTFTLAKSKTAYKDNQEHFFDNGDGTYTIRSYAINAYDLMQNKNTPKNTPIKLKVNGKVVQQASYNVMDYIYQLQDTTQSGSLALKYARSLYRYGQSATVAYKGNRVVSIALNNNPSNIVPGNKNAQTPTGGSITAYYSDGTSKVINEGITWLNKDIHGNEVKITDDTYEKSFTVMGSYTDSISGKTYTVTGTVLLRNSMTKIERYTDPSIYSPTSYAASYTPVNSVVKCTWNNGFVAYRTPTHSAINMTDYKEDEYGFIPTTATYKDPKSGVTKTVTTYLLYKNPITAITVADTTANYNDGTLDNSTTPAASTYTVTYQNKHTTTAKNTSSSWTSTINNAGSNLSKTYSFAWTALTSNSTSISFTQTATGTLNKPAYSTWNRMVDGQNEAFSTTALTTTDTCTATVSNPEYQLTFPIAPSIYDGTVKTTNNLTGSKSSTTAGQWSGGQVIMRYYNDATEDVTASVTYSSPSITDTAYSKSVTVTAAYTKKNGAATTVTKSSVTIYNYLTGVSQYKNAQVYAASTANTQLPLANTAGTILATYANGKTEVVGTGAASDTNIYIGTSSTIRNTACYVETITSASATTVERSTATTTASSTSRSTLKIKYDDYRTSTSYTGSIQEISGYKVTVINRYESISTSSVGPVYMTAASTTPKPTNKVTVVFSNGTTASVSATYTQPAHITDATEYVDRTITASCKDALGYTVSKSVTCRVINQPASAVVKTQPAQKTVTSQGQFPASSVTGGVLTVTFANGQKADKACTSYATTSSTLLTGTTASGTFNITGYYAGTYNTVSATMQLPLINTPASATYSPNSITLSSSGQKPSGTLAVKYDNGYVENHTVTSSTTIYSSGTASNSGATTATSGTCSVAASKTVAGESMSATGTCSWSNPLKSISDNGGANRNCADAGKTITMSNSYVNGESVKATYTNGATKNVEPKLPGDEWANASGTSTITYSVPVSYTDGGVTKTCNITVTIYVPLSSISTSAKTATFSSTSVSTSISTVTGTYKNGKTKSLTPTLSTKSNGNSSSTISISGTTVTCTYSGTDYAKWSSTITATAGGKSCTVTINYVNTPTMETYTSKSTSGTKVNDSTGGAARTYGKVYFDGGSCYTESSYGSIYGYVKFKNGQGKWVTPGDGATLTDFSHTSYLQYKNGKSFSASTGTNGSLSSATLTYSISATYNAGTASSCTDTFYIYTLTSNHGYFYVPQEIQLEAGDDLDHINAEDWEAYHDIYYFGKNRTTSGTPTSSRNGGYYDQFAWTATGLTNSTTYKGGVYSSSSAKVASSNITSSSSWYIYGSGNIARTKAGNPITSAGWYGNDYYLAAYLTTKLYSSTLGNVYAMNGGYWSYACSIEEMGY